MIPAFFGFALAVAYVPWITGAAATPRWCVLVALAAWALVFLPRTRWQTAPVVLGCAFMGWAMASIIFSPALEARDQAWKLALYAALFLAGGQMSSLRPFYMGAAVGLAVNGAVVIADLAHLIEYQQVGRPSGLFVNGIYLAEFAALIMAGLIGSGLHRWAAACVPCLFFVALARGAILALLVAGAAHSWRPWMFRYWPVAFGAGMVAIVGLAVLRPSTVMVRLDLWWAVLQHLNWQGHGLGAFFGDGPLMSVYDDLIRSDRPPHANNDLIEIAYDLGPVGVILAMGFLVSLLRGPMSAERLVILVFIIEGCFGFPFYLPWSAGVFCLAAGHIAGGGRVRVRAPDGSGMALREWHGGAVHPGIARSPDGLGGNVPLGVYVPVGAVDPVTSIGPTDAGGCAVGGTVSDAGCSS